MPGGCVGPGRPADGNWSTRTPLSAVVGASGGSGGGHPGSEDTWTGPCFVPAQNHRGSGGGGGGDGVEGGVASGGMAFGINLSGCESFQPGLDGGQDPSGVWDSTGVGMQVGIVQAEVTDTNSDRWEACWEWVRTGWCPRGETCRWEHPPLQALGYSSGFQFWGSDEGAPQSGGGPGDFPQQAAAWSIAGGPGTAPGADFVPTGGPCGSVVSGPLMAAPLHQGLLAPQGLHLQEPGPPQGLPLQVGAATPTMEDYDGLPMTPRDGD